MSKMLLKQLVKGDNYKDLNKTITINIVDFNCIDNEIKEAMDILYQISGDKELVQLAEIRDKAIRDENDRFRRF